jgi:phage-related protein
VAAKGQRLVVLHVFVKKTQATPGGRLKPRWRA